MKYKLKNVKALKLALSIFGVGAGVGFALGLLVYLQVNRQIDAGESSAQMTQALVEAAHFNVLLHELNTGHTEQAKKYLTSEMAYDMRTVESLAPAQSTQDKWFAQFITEHIARDEKKHPDYYLASTKPSHL